MTYLLLFSLNGFWMPWSATLYTRSDCEAAGEQLVMHLKRINQPRPIVAWCREWR